MALFIASDQVGGWKTAEKSKKKKKENKKKRIRIDRFFHTHTHKKKKKTDYMYVRIQLQTQPHVHWRSIYMASHWDTKKRHDIVAHTTTTTRLSFSVMNNTPTLRDKLLMLTVGSIKTGKNTIENSKKHKS
jgi:hypothetical protein